MLEGVYNILPSGKISDDKLCSIINENFNSKNTLKICCFSQKFPKDSLAEHLMWAHYANNHLGLRVDFSLPDYEIFSDDLQIDDFQWVEKICDVKYGERRTYKKDNFSNDLLLNLNDLFNIFTNKLSCWRYEQESRIITRKSHIKIKIRSITLGRALLPINRCFDGGGELPFSILDLAENIKNLCNDENIKIYAYKSRSSNECIEIFTKNKGVSDEI